MALPPGAAVPETAEGLAVLVNTTGAEARAWRAEDSSHERLHHLLSELFSALPDTPERAAEANRKEADLYVSLHFNGFDGPGNNAVQGLETYCLTPAGAPSSNDSQRHGRMAGFDANRFDRENVTLAHLVHRAILDQTPLADRGVRRARFKELTLLRMPGLLIEGGYMTHPGDTRLMDSQKSRDQLAAAIADGILRHKKLVERGTPE
jgi:N-acetylmuramoyl-L-alanine amidase